MTADINAACAIFRQCPTPEYAPLSKANRRSPLQAKLPYMPPLQSAVFRRSPSPHLQLPSRASR
ncbi:hypothetical protein U9M48_041822 [Paspalum notatum var. saurae]|uniref:Uncharacterized protein n=1 Tax=Paspalum notatum var. saurae TaxID=547442 RepID=A0AAQ3UPW2_PASNO